MISIGFTLRFAAAPADAGEAAVGGGYLEEREPCRI
jgi:hypothetical protein